MDKTDVLIENTILEKYRAETAKIQEDSEHSGKGHYNASERWDLVNLRLGISTAIIALIASISTFSGLQAIGGYLAILVATATTVMAFLKPGDRASIHARCGGEYLALRNRARIFHEIISLTCKTNEELHARFEELVTKRDNLNVFSPRIPRHAYEKAKKSIADGESKYTNSGT
ncbi:MAG TPA: hypothetical protein DEF07_07410 [Nitrosomonas sp.]|nr:hypothetical protein [Nitrosomonas sp.]